MGELTKQDIIEKLAKEKAVEEIIHNICKKEESYFFDLAQDIYVSLMEKSDELIISLYNKNQILFYITRMALNNIFSKNSPFYCKYKRFSNSALELWRQDKIDNEQYKS
jgi:hypothetical protein